MGSFQGAGVLACNLCSNLLPGIAYLSGVCLGHRVSIQEEMGFFQGAGVLAHELGHK